MNVSSCWRQKSTHSSMDHPARNPCEVVEMWKVEPQSNDQLTFTTEDIWNSFQVTKVEVPLLASHFMHSNKSFLGWPGSYRRSSPPLPSHFLLGFFLCLLWWTRSGFGSLHIHDIYPLWLFPVHHLFAHIRLFIQSST